MPTTATERSRLRFARLARDPTPDGRCQVKVELEWRDRTYEAAAESFNTQQGLINAATEAALRAVHSITEDVHFDVVGVKAVRAFDGWVVVIRLTSTHDGETQRLLGAAPCEGEDALPAAAVMATLDASNRVLERALA